MQNGELMSTELKAFNEYWDEADTPTEGEEEAFHAGFSAGFRAGRETTSRAESLPPDAAPFRIIAILMQAGDDEDGIPRIVFQVAREDLKKLNLPLYQKRLLTVSELPRCQDEETND